MNIITNNQRRPLRSLDELTTKEREEFDYIDQTDDRIEWEPRFFRYKGNVYDTQDCERVPITLPKMQELWDGIYTETFFSGVLFRYDRETMQEYDFVIVGRYYA